jgi:hypothetical protein
MPRAHIVLSYLLTTLLGAGITASAEIAPIDCSLSAVAISPGMVRAEVEAQVARLLGVRLNYSTEANNLTGGTVAYRTDTCVLVVVYKAGAPAPLVSTGQREVRHLPAKDETVASYTVQPTSPQSTKARSKAN